MDSGLPSRMSVVGVILPFLVRFAINPEFMDLSQGEAVVRAVRNLLLRDRRLAGFPSR